MQTRIAAGRSEPSGIGRGGAMKRPLLAEAARRRLQRLPVGVRMGPRIS